MRKIGVNTADKTRPYLFQLMEKFETAREKTGADEGESVKGGSTSQASKFVDAKDKQTKPPAQVLPNKPAPTPEPPRPKIEEVPPKRIQNEPPKPAPAKPALQKTATDDQMDSLRSQKKKSERVPTDERVPTEDRDMFQSESLGLDVTINSEAINQFDYNESVDRDD